MVGQRTMSALIGDLTGQYLASQFDWSHSIMLKMK